MQGTKHLVECNCVLSQYRHVVPAVFHKFVVFSVTDDDGNIVQKHVQCTNCGVIHRVDNLTRSTILPRETLASVSTIEDVKQSLDPAMIAVLERHDVDLATWENVEFIVTHELWGSCVSLASDKIDDTVQRKVLCVLGPRLFRIDQQSMTDTINVERKR